MVKLNAKSHNLMLNLKYSNFRANNLVAQNFDYKKEVKSNNNSLLNRTDLTVGSHQKIELNTDTEVMLFPSETMCLEINVNDCLDCESFPANLTVKTFNKHDTMPNMDVSISMNTKFPKKF